MVERISEALSNLRNMPNQIVTSDKEIYIKQCRSVRVEPQKDILEALVHAEAYGALNLSNKNLNIWTWQTLGKVISSSPTITSLNFSNCLIPPRGLALLLIELGQSSKITHLDLRGNNIQTSSLAYLGGMLRTNATIKKLCLEWNKLGVYPDSFSLFCEGLADNQTLEELDLRNNQISSDCSTSLAKALMKNSSLKVLDLRWNNLGWAGGQHLYAGLNENQSLTDIKLEGNCIPMDILTALEQCAKHNSTKQRIMDECKAKTEFLAQHLRKAEEVRTKVINNMTKRTDDKIKHIVRQSEERLKQLELMLNDRSAAVSHLEQELEITKNDLKRNRDLLTKLEADDQDKALRLENLQSQLASTKKKYVEKESEFSSIEISLKSRLSIEEKKNSTLENEVQSQSKEIKSLEYKVNQLKDEIKASKSEYEDLLHKERLQANEMLQQVEKQKDEQIAQQKLIFRSRIQELETSIEELEKGKGELASALSMEKARKEQDIVAATNALKQAESAKSAKLEEKINTLREEKAVLEQQLSVSHSTISQLQQQNNKIIADVSDSQKKITQLCEDLSNERLLSQRLQQELSDEKGKLSSLRKEVESLQGEIDSLHRQSSDQVRQHAVQLAEKDKELAKLHGLLAQREREIQSIRSEEMERAGVLYSAFNKYLGSINPATAAFSK